MTNTPILPRIDPVAYIRTIVPVLYGLGIAKLIALIPAVQSVIDFLNAQIGPIWEQVIIGLATAAITFAYYWLARQIGRRWPSAEKWLLGSSAKPVYVDFE